MKFRKRPVVIEARQLTVNDVVDICNWCGGFDWDTDPVEFKIRTREGVMKAREGDWIIRGVRGEFYPCKPDIFAATYDPVAP